LNSKNINSLFISIVENLLIEKPANPIAFMIEYLYKQYPDQGKLALENISPVSYEYRLSFLIHFILLFLIITLQITFLDPKLKARALKLRSQQQ
jgi:hypothetical protein